MQPNFSFSQMCVFITLSGNGRRETPCIRPHSRYNRVRIPMRPQKTDCITLKADKWRRETSCTRSHSVIGSAIAHNDKDTGSNPVETTKKYVLEMIYSTESPAPQRGVDIIIVKGRMICWQSTVED